MFLGFIGTSWNDVFLNISTAPSAIVVLMLQLPKLIKHRIIDRISIHDLMIVIILIVTGITFSSASAQSNKAISCLKDTSKTHPQYVFSKPNVNLRTSPGDGSPRVRKTIKRELLRVIDRECGQEGKENQTEWYEVELLDGKFAYIATSFVSPLNKGEKKDTEAWKAFKKERTIEKLEAYQNKFPSGFFSGKAKDFDIKFKVVFLRNALDEKNIKIKIYIGLYSDKNISTSGTQQPFTGSLAKKRNDFEAKLSSTISKLDSLEDELAGLEKDSKLLKYPRRLRIYEKIKSKLAKIISFNNDQNSGLWALSEQIEEGISAFLKPKEPNGSEISTKSEDDKPNQSIKKAQAPVSLPVSA